MNAFPDENRLLWELATAGRWDEAREIYLKMLAPVAPHITEELWSRRLAAAGQEWSSIHSQPWPEVDPSAVVEATREVPVQVNGKLRDRITVPAGVSTEELERLVLASPRIQTYLGGKAPDRVVHAGGGRLVNVVVR